MDAQSGADNSEFSKMHAGEFPRLIRRFIREMNSEFFTQNF
jgi:hypothetical protein